MAKRKPLPKTDRKRKVDTKASKPAVVKLEETRDLSNVRRVKVKEDKKSNKFAWFVLLIILAILIIVLIPTGGNTDTTLSPGDDFDNLRTDTQNDEFAEANPEPTITEYDAQILARTHLLSRDEFKNSKATNIELVDALPANKGYKFLYTYEVEGEFKRVAVTTYDKRVVATVFGEAGEDCYTDLDCIPDDYEGTDKIFYCEEYKCHVQ
ncbi:hypothetical protein JW868_02735 [Candidatus Woesearchaeota archaeon]|nr:hypothetical protein [Candidatus Woesearchaeota archaeon]